MPTTRPGPAATAIWRKRTASWRSRTPAARSRLAAISGALATLAGPVAGGYAQRKDDAGLLDYDDLIDRTRDLLVDPGAAWVLYKLDGGLDHLLLDEVQDTAPAAMAHRPRADRGVLRRRGRAGPDAHGVRGRRPQAVDLLVPGRRPGGVRPLPRRTGAPRRERPARRSRDVGLDVSFRSTAPVLALVDAVFADPLARPGVVGGRARRWRTTPTAPAMPGWWNSGRWRRGRDPAPHRPWTVPRAEPVADARRAQLLADALADWIRDQTDGVGAAGKQGPAAARRATCWCWCAGATSSPARWCGR